MHMEKTDTENGLKIQILKMTSDLMEITEVRLYHGLKYQSNWTAFHQEQYRKDTKSEKERESSHTHPSLFLPLFSFVSLCVHVCMRGIPYSSHLKGVSRVVQWVALDDMLSDRL